jgi:hypothetical protein
MSEGQMRRIIALASICVILAIAAVAGEIVISKTRASPDLFSGDEKSSEWRVLMLKAVKGSVVAADQLMTKYSYCHKMEWPSEREREKCLKSLGYWTDIALQNGSTAAAQHYVTDLLGSHKCVDAYRAEFWYKRFKTAYASHPRFLSSVAEEIEMNKAACTW